MLQAREDHLNNVLEEARANLTKISDDSNRYPAILKGLILQVGRTYSHKGFGAEFIFSRNNHLLFF